MSQDVVKFFMSVFPVVLTPLIVWALNRFGTSSDEARITQLSKRLDLIARLHQMQSEIKDPSLKELFDAESEWCKQYLTSQAHVEATFLDKVRKAEPLSLISRLFLTTPSITKKHRVLRAFFYVFFIFFILELLAFIAVLFSSGLQNVNFVFLGGALFYLSLALVFRMFARHN